MTPVALATRGPSIYPIIVTLVLGTVLFSRFAVPGFDQSLSMSILILSACMALAWVTGRIRINANGVLLWACLVTLGMGSYVINAGSQPVSINSLALMAIIQAPFMFRLGPMTRDTHRGLAFYIHVMFVLGLLGALQFLLQQVIGTENAFFMDFRVPPALLLRPELFNTLNTLEYGSDLYKSNGLFFLEPSHFSQYLALAIVAELSTRQRKLILLGLATGMLFSFSGTGMMVLALFGLFFALRSRRNAMLALLAALLAGLAIYFAEDLNLTVITDRIKEFSTPNSSGHARFVSIFSMLDLYSFNSLTSSLVGNGPGSISPYTHRLHFEAHDPTWGKLVFEYGLLGLAFYVAYLKSASFPHKAPLTAPALITFFFMGGYLLDPIMMSILFILLILGPREWDQSRYRSHRLSPPRPALDGASSAVARPQALTSHRVDIANSAS